MMMKDDNITREEQCIDFMIGGYQRLISADRYDVRAAACGYRDIAVDAYGGSDDTRAILNMAIFIRCVKLVRLCPQHIVEWLARQDGGSRAIFDYARTRQDKDAYNG